jgi:hypothetical protein
LPAAVHVLVFGYQSGELCAREAVERFALGRRGSQPNLIGLPVNDDELLADLIEHANRRRAPTNHRATAALL